MAQVVGPELQLESVRRPGERPQGETCVVDQQIDGAGSLAGEGPHGGEVGEIEGADLDRPRHVRRRRLPLLWIAYGQDNTRSALGEDTGCDEPDSAVRTGDDGSATGQVGQFGERESGHTARVDIGNIVVNDNIELG